MKFVRKGARPVSGDTGLFEIQDLAQAGNFSLSGQGTYSQINTRDAYIRHLLGYLDADRQKPLKIVVNAGNGGAGRVIDALAEMIREGSSTASPDDDVHDRARMILASSAFLAKMVFDGVSEARRESFVQHVLQPLIP